MADTAITGAAGAYYAAGQLSERGWQAALTWGNAPRTDIIAQHADHPERVLGIQVKTRRSGDFRVGTKAEEKPSPPDADEWFILVSLQGPDSRPRFYIVPWNHVAALAVIAYDEATRKPGSKPNKNRLLGEGEFQHYEDQWDLLDGSPHDVPYAGFLPDWVWDHTGVALPPGLPPLER